jgi:hypothetical protein
MKSWRESHALSCGCWPAQVVASAQASASATVPAPVARPPPKEADEPEEEGGGGALLAALEASLAARLAGKACPG